MRYTIKILLSAAGGILSVLEPTVNYAAICFFAVLIDTLTAFRLGRRVRKNHPGSNDGKFKSDYAKRIFNTLLIVYSVIVLVFFVDTYILTMFNGLYLANYVAAVFCFVQLWSILENESSENGAKWAILLQKIMVNKAERHMNINLDEYKHET